MANTEAGMNAQRLPKLEEVRSLPEQGNLKPEPQWIVFGIGLFTTVLLAAAFGSVVYLSLIWGDAPIKAPWLILSLTAIAGVFGGSGRSIFTMIYGGDRTKRSRIPTSSYSRHWTLYLLSPFMGGTSGVLFFLAINYGLVRPLMIGLDPQQFSFLPVFLISAAGGVFFDEVFSVLSGLVGIFSAGQEKS